MSDSISSIINDYSTNPINNFVLEDYTVKYEEGNAICDDTITVFLKINQDKIEKYSYVGELSMVGLAAASILAEEIQGKSIYEVLNWDYEFMKNLGFEVSPRRKRASVMPILAVRNAIHTYLGDGKKDDFDDLVDGC